VGQERKDNLQNIRAVLHWKSSAQKILLVKSIEGKEGKLMHYKAL